MEPTKEKIIEWLRDAEKFLETPDDYPPYANWLYAREIGIYNAVLGNKDEAIKGFKKAVEYAKKKIEEDKENNKMLITSYRDYLFTALLTQDEKLIKKSAEELYKVEDELKKRTKYKDSLFIYYYTFALVNLIKENCNKVDEYLKRLDEYKTIPKYSYPMSDVIKGILKKDTKSLEKGFNEIFKKHELYIRYCKLMLPQDKLVCDVAVVMLFLAKKRGINIKIESKYIPKVLFEEK